MASTPGGGAGSTGPEQTEKPPAEAPDVLETVAPEPEKAPEKPDQQDALGLSADEEAELARLQGKAAAAAAHGQVIRMKVEPPHSQMTHGMVTVGNEFTSVPAFMAAALESAASEAGVKLTREG